MNYPEVIERREELKLSEKVSKWYLLGAYIGDFSRNRITGKSVRISLNQ